MKSDPYSGTIKGEDYAKFRPKYPSHFLTAPLKDVKKKGKYLDVATGPGHIMFEIASEFKEVVGMDKSQTMINGCMSKLPEHPNVRVEVCDFMEW